MPSVVRRAVRRARNRRAAEQRSRTAPVYLIAAAGQPNFGDEFITRAWLDWLAEQFPQREVWLDCPEPGRAAHLFRDSHPRLRTTNTLWQAAYSADPDLIGNAAQRMEDLVLHLGSPKVDFGLRDLREMSSLHLLGGGYLNSIWPHNLAIVAAMTAVRRHFGVPLFATGQGFLPHEPQTREWMSAQLAQFDYVESRDSDGAKAFGVHHGLDDAFLAFANNRPVFAPAAELPSAMVLIQGDMFPEADEEQLSAAIADFVRAQGGPSQVGFVEGIPPEDARFAWPWLDAGATSTPSCGSGKRDSPRSKGNNG